MTDRLIHHRQGRTPRAILVLLACWAVLGWLALGLQAAGWIVALLGLVTLPLLWDILRNSDAWLALDRDGLRWQSGFGTADLALARIDHLRLSRRLDLSMRVTVVLRDGQRLRLPPDLQPPVPALEATARALGLRVEQHPFALGG